MDGWREDGIGQRRDDCGRCVTMRESWELLESSDARVDN